MGQTVLISRKSWRLPKVMTNWVSRLQAFWDNKLRASSSSFHSSPRLFAWDGVSTNPMLWQPGLFTIELNTAAWRRLPSADNTSGADQLQSTMQLTSDSVTLWIFLMALSRFRTSWKALSGLVSTVSGHMRQCSLLKSRMCFAICLALFCLATFC